jgi:hypothetical protein
MTEDEERHADEVNIAFQMGAEWQKKQNDSAWKGIHEGAVLAMQAHIKELEQSLATTFQNFMDEGLRAEKLEAAMQEIADLNNKRDRFSSEIDTIITRALGEKNAHD